MLLTHVTWTLSPTGLLAQRMFVMLPCGGVGVSMPRDLKWALPRVFSLPFGSLGPLPPLCHLGLVVLPDWVGQGLSQYVLLAGSSM